MATLAVVAVGAAAIAVAAMRSGSGEPDAAAALERARAAMAEAGTFRMSATVEDRSVVGDLDGPGSQTLYRTVTEAEVAGDAWHAVSDRGDWADEIVWIDGTIYERYADDVGALADEPWAVWPLEDVDDALVTDGDLVDMLLVFTGLDVDGDGEIDPDAVGDPEFAESMIVPALAAYYLWGAEQPATPMAGDTGVPLPSGLIDTFSRFDDAEVVADGDDGMTIAATRQVPDEVAAEIATAVGVSLPEGRIEIDLSRDGLPTSLRLTVEGSSASYTQAIAFSDWGADITIGVPEGEIDETPWIDEEVLAEIRGTLTALAPTHLPDDLELVDIYAMPAEEAAEWGEPCGQLNLMYAPPVTDGPEADAWFESPDHLDVYLLPANCAAEADPTPFAPGAYGDVPSRHVHGVVEVRIGDTVVQIDTTYTAELQAMVASIEPFDLDAALARLEVFDEGGWFGAAAESTTEQLA